MTADNAQPKAQAQAGGVFDEAWRLGGEHSSARSMLREIRDEMLALIHGDIDDAMCPAIGFGECSIKPVGPGGAMQCQWCGEPPVENGPLMGWQIERREDRIVVQHPTVGGYAARADDENIASTILYHLAASCLAAEGLTVTPAAERR